MRPLNTFNLSREGEDRDMRQRSPYHTWLMPLENPIFWRIITILILFFILAQQILLDKDNAMRQGTIACMLKKLTNHFEDYTSPDNETLEQEFDDYENVEYRNT